ncbi:discoidin domain-containing protein [Anaerobaca lacustris]|uniref:Discoidin domain-containing protein n=1 Tax=Anaerobaca lacustris TaxID=3044600 RepID=A0AAW6TYB4_9BACT|nr:discoidin domain-containing protein [Sedimentisphaerales bacterium M17dextr]
MCRKVICFISLVLAFGLVTSRDALAEATQFDFAGDLRASFGPGTLGYYGASSDLVSFGTASAFGLPALPGGDAAVMQFPAFSPSQGLSFDTASPPSGGGSMVNQYTMIWDVLYPNVGAVGYACLYQADGTNTSDGELFINSAGGIGVHGNYPGKVNSNQWHRIAVVVDLVAQTMAKYIDGVHIGTQTLTSAVDGRHALHAAGSALNTLLLTDEDNETNTGYINCFYFVDELLSESTIEEFGGPHADGVIASAVTKARNPDPADADDDVPLDAVLSWTPGKTAVARDVYFGIAFADANDASRANPADVLVSQAQAAATYEPTAPLEYGQTYYWRIDEVNAAPDFTVFKGDVWSFTTEPFAYPVADVIASSNGISDQISTPQRTVDGSGLDADGQHSMVSSDMWAASAPAEEPLTIQYEFDRIYKLQEMLVWNYNVQFETILGFGLKDVTVEYSEDGDNWIVLGDVEFARATATATYTANTVVDFGGVPARFVRLTIHSSWGGTGQYGLSEVRFLFIPAQTREPQPADGATDVSVDSMLAWRAGRDAVSHEVYLGTDADALAPASTVSGNSYAPGGLNLASTYYWQVNAIQETESWDGPIWSFATQEYLVVEDFESYTDDIDAGEAIFDTWIDGWVNNTGSTVGHLETPFAERAIVHSGRQSMPLFYDNTTTAVSEADYALSGNWTLYGIKSLSLYFYGAEGNTGQLYVKINNTKIAYDGPAVNLARPSWQLWSIDLSQAGNVSNVSSLTIGIEGVGATGVLYIDDIRLYPEVLQRVSADITGAGDVVKGVPDDGDWPAAEHPALAIDDDVNTKFLHFKGKTEPTGIQVTPLVGATIVTGLTLTTANDAPERDPVAFELYGSNASIDGPYTLIVAGDVVDFAGATAWPRFTKNATPIDEFDNSVAYLHYQVLFPTVRNPASANSMQIAEIELLGAVAD